MLRKRFPSFFCPSLTVLVLALTLIPGAWAAPKFKILHTVPGGLFSGLTLDAKGNLFGTTTGGGTYNDGTIFELSPGSHGWTLSTIHSFDGYHGSGGTGVGGMIFDAAGNLFGTAPGGVPYGGGVAFEMTPQAGGWSYAVIYDFCQQYHCPDGGDPNPVIFDGAGNLYGTTAGGGTSGAGVAFKLWSGSDGWQETVLYNFDGSKKSGIYPSGPLVFDSSGDLYGTTPVANIYQEGTVFKLKHLPGGGWTETTLVRFNGINGAEPSYGVVFDAAGNLYGATVTGGPKGAGTVFKLAPEAKGGWKETLLYDFPEPANGEIPSGGVVFDSAGNVYGATAQGGIGPCYNGCGVVYKLSPDAKGKWNYTVLHKFDSQAESPSDGGLVVDKKGNLYGAAYTVVFEVTP
jgi:uncharacterized repeat protein (TIGR03803 family)